MPDEVAFGRGLSVSDLKSFAPISTASPQSSSPAYLQDLVYKLSKVGQAIEKNDLPAASSVLGSSKDTAWFQKVNSAMNKLLLSVRYNSCLSSYIGYWEIKKLHRREIRTWKGKYGPWQIGKNPE